MTMDKFFKAYLNWRINVLSILSIIVMIFIISDSENVLVFALTKISGFVLGYLTFILGKYWDSKGKINELTEIAKDE